MGWQDAPVVGDAPSANPVTATPQPSQADVRKADLGLVAKAPPKRRSFIPGDFGSLLSAGEAQGAANRALDRVAYAAGGKVTDAASAMGLPPQAAAGAGYATNVGVGAIPMLLGGEGAVATKAPQAMRKGAIELMQSALKPAKGELKSGKGLQAAKTMLEQGANVTPGGVEKLTKTIDKLDDELERVIKNSKGDVDKISVLMPLREELRKFREKANPNADMAEIRQAAKEFWNHPALRGSDTIPVQQAQAMKRATYRGLGSKAYGAGLKSDAERDAQKALARGLKEGVERAAPEAGAINAQMSPLINARDIAQNRVLMSGNKNLLGFGALHPQALPVWLADRSELVKSLGARGLYSGAEPLTRGLGQAAGGAVGAYEETPPRK